MDNTIPELIESLDKLKNALSAKQHELLKIQIANNYAQNLYNFQERIETAEKRITELILENTDENKKEDVKTALKNFGIIKQENERDLLISELINTLENLQFQIHFAKDKAIYNAVKLLDDDKLCKFIHQAEEEFPEFEHSLREQFFLFENIEKYDDRAIQKILREIDSRELAVALCGSSEKLKNKFINNMSERAGKMLLEEIEILNGISESNSIRARNRIAALLFRLFESGELILPENDSLPHSISSIGANEITLSGSNGK